MFHRWLILGLDGLGAVIDGALGLGTLRAEQWAISRHRNRFVLRSFADKDTERVWRRERSHRLDQHTQRAAGRKLLILDAAETLDDVRIPPGNRLEKLRGDRAGQYSIRVNHIRVNQQWRICFRWTAAGPEDIEITDYH